MRDYPTNLTEKQWQVIKNILEPQDRTRKNHLGKSKRWIVEKISWIENYRRLAIDYESLRETAEAMVSIAFIQIALNGFFKSFKFRK